MNSLIGKEIVADGRSAVFGRGTGSFAGPARGALAEERFKALSEILRLPDLRAPGRGQFEFAGDFRSGKIAKQLFGHVKADRAAGEQTGRKDLRRNHQFFLRDDLRDETQAMRFGGVNGSSCQ